MKNRLIRLREKLNDSNVDAILITKRQNYMYLSGFTGTAAHLLITAEDAYLITDFRYVEQASKQAPLFEVIKYQGSIELEIKKILEKLSIRKLGFEAGNLTYDKYLGFKEKLDDTELIPLKDFVESLRMVKSEEEIEKIKKAVEIADKAFEHILDYIKPGITENEIAAELEYFMKKNGAQGPSFETIVASGTRSAMPHGVASEKEIQHGDIITMDYGAIYEGYCSDMTRTVFVGHAQDKLKEIYEIVLNAQVEALRGAFEGKTGREIDSIAREIIAKAGYGENFGHGLGHGVGLEIHEEPRLSVSGEKVMKNGMVVTVEPGIYIEGLGGVRIEDMIVINDNQPLILTKSPKELIIVG